ncbi:MAG: PAS domain S-box protein [Acidobacteriota bacterium]
MDEQRTRHSKAGRDRLNRSASGKGPGVRPAFLLSLWEVGRDAVLLTDAKGRILEANRAAESMYGWKEKELRSLSLADLQAKGTAAFVEERFRSSPNTDIPVFETVQLHRQRGPFPAEMAVRPLTFNRAQSWIVVARDISERKQAEERFHELEAHFHALVDGAAATIFILQDQHFVEVNRAAEALTGYTREELLSMHFLQVVHPDFRELVGSRTASRLRGADPPHRYEFKILRKDGQERWIDLSVGRTLFRGKPALIDSVWDISERKLAEARLAQQNRLYRTLSAINQMLVRAESDRAVLSETCRILTAEGGYPLACALLREPGSGRWVAGFQNGAASGFCALVHGGDFQCPVIEAVLSRLQEPIVTIHNAQSDPLYEPWREPVRACGLGLVAILPLRQGGDLRGALTVYASQGHTFESEERALLAELAGDLEYALTAFAERQKREQAERAFREREERFRLLFERNVAGVFRTAQDGRILECNERLASIFGAASVEEMMRHSAEEIFPRSEDREAYLAQLREMGEITNLQWLCRRLDGSPAWILENVTLVDDPRYEEPVLEGSMIDITALKQAEEEVRESEARFKTLAETSAAGILVFQEDRFVYANSSALEIAEASFEELQAMFFWEGVHPRFRGQVRELGRACLAGEFAPRRFDLQIITKHGQRRWVDCTLARAHMNGKPAGVVTLVDITERRRSERLQSALYAIAQASLSADSLDRFLPAVHEALQHLVPARNFFVVLERQETAGLAYAYRADERSEDTPCAAPDHGPERWVFDHRKPLLADASRLRDLAASDEVAAGVLNCTAWLGVPLRLKDRLLGVMGVYSYGDEVRFEPRHQESLTLVASQVAMAIERMRGEEALRNSEHKFRMLTEASAAGILIYQGERILYGNPAALAMTGYSREEFLRLRFWELVHPDHRELVRQRGMARQKGESVPSHYEFKIVTKAGQPRWMDFTASEIPYGGQNAVVVMAFDITDRKQAEEQLAYLAHYDGLTGLPNRLLLQDRLSKHLDNCARGRERLAVILLGLDRFKEINDTVGQEVGDELLRETARRLIRLPNSEASRLGSDEFVLVLAGEERCKGVDAYLRLLTETFRPPIRVASQDYHLGFSAGVSFYPEDGPTPEALLRCADIAMGRAKRYGGATVEFFTESMSRMVSERADLRQRLRRALERGELEAFYQIIQASTSERVLGVEALVRWRQEEGELVLPGSFIEVAEESDLILSIDQWMLRTACTQRRAWNDAGFLQVPVSVNLSARQFLKPGSAALVHAILEETELPSSQLVLEITEATAMWDLASTMRILNQLDEMGVAIAIDDFGSGYSSLMYLKQLPIRLLKIPQAFVRELPLDLRDVAIVQAIINLSHGLHLSVVAEGVETAEQLHFLAGIGCDAVQGFHCARPMPAAELARMLEGKG